MSPAHKVEVIDALKEAHAALTTARRAAENVEIDESAINVKVTNWPDENDTLAAVAEALSNDPETEIEDMDGALDMSDTVEAIEEAMSGVESALLTLTGHTDGVA